MEAESNLQDVANLIGSLHRNKEPLLHCAVYIEMIAGDMQELQILQTNVEVELMRSKLNVDRLKLRQQAGFCAVSPVGYNAFGTEYELSLIHILRVHDFMAASLDELRQYSEEPQLGGM